jgi:predicted DNA-binding transcriptional regulator AlpA
MGLSDHERRPSGRLVSVEETCAILGVSRSEYYRLAKEDPAFPPGYRVTSRRTHDYDELRAYRESKREKSK